jgi:hypothetical protein
MSAYTDNSSNPLASVPTADLAKNRAAAAAVTPHLAVGMNFDHGMTLNTPMSGGKHGYKEAMSAGYQAKSPFSPTGLIVLPIGKPDPVAVQSINNASPCPPTPCYLVPNHFSTFQKSFEVIKTCVNKALSDLIGAYPDCLDFGFFPAVSQVRNFRNLPKFECDDNNCI